MEEILFRGKECTEGKWIVGSLVNRGESSSIVTETGNYIDVDPKTVGQFTGVRDVNGVPVFEGDVLLFDTHRYVVRYSSEFASFICTDNPRTTDRMLGILVSNFKLFKCTGNIYDSGFNF